MAGKRKRKGPKRKAKIAKVGRPSDYDPAFCEKAMGCYAQGATDLEVADVLGVHAATLYRWQHEHPEFREAAKIGKEAGDERVERSLYHRAVGYSFDSVKILQHNGRPVLVPFREHVPPDVGAAFNWLKNRRPDVWRDVKEINGRIQLADLIAQSVAAHEPE